MVCPAATLAAQPTPGSVVVISADEYEVVRLTTCPTRITGGLAGYFDGYVYGGHEWTPDWRRHNVLDPVMYSLARYHPWGWDGYAMGRGDYIVSRDNQARWYQAEIEVRCTATDRYLFGRLVATLDRYKAVGNFGTVEECSSGPHTGYLDQTAYDPYDSGWGGEGDSCATHTGGGSEGGGSGTQFEPGQHTGGETVDWATGIGNGGTSVCGDAAVVDYVCIEIWNDVGQKWDYYACGYATTC